MLIFNNKFISKNLLVWGNLSDDLIKYYRKGDYIIVEGFLTTVSNFDVANLEKRERKVFEFTVLKIYPVF